MKNAITKSDIPDNAVCLIDRMFVRLKSIFPAWKQAFNSEIEYNETKQVWLEELFKAGVVNPQSLKLGLNLAAKSENPFFPSVGEFISWCKSYDYAELNLPDEDVLLKRVHQFMGYGMSEVDKFKFTSDSEYWLVTELYVKNRNNKWDEKQLKRAVSDSLKAMAERIKKGEVIPAPQKQLPQEVKKQATAETIKNHLNNFKAMLGRRVA